MATIKADKLVDLDGLESSVINILDFALEQVYADKNINLILYDPDWQKLLSEVKISKNQIDGKSADDIARYILDKYYLSVTIIDDAALVHRKGQVIHHYRK